MSEKPAPTRPSSKPPSRRFDPSIWSARIAPVVITILALALLVTLAIIVLSVLGLTPGI
jgi:hypothetical protein